MPEVYPTVKCRFTLGELAQDNERFNVAKVFAYSY